MGKDLEFNVSWNIETQCTHTHIQLICNSVARTYSLLTVNPVWGDPTFVCKSVVGARCCVSTTHQSPRLDLDSPLSAYKMHLDAPNNETNY